MARIESSKLVNDRKIVPKEQQIRDLLKSPVGIGIVPWSAGAFEEIRHEMRLYKCALQVVSS